MLAMKHMKDSFLTNCRPDVGRIADRKKDGVAPHALCTESAPTVGQASQGNIHPFPSPITLKAACLVSVPSDFLSKIDLTRRLGNWLP
jgi:hypothetical protein